MFSFAIPLRRLVVAAGLGCTLTLSAQAQAPSAPTLRQALDAAWALSPASRSATHRLDELQARQRATRSLFPGAPSVTLAHRTDRIGSNGGLREYEAEVGLPLWQPAVRAATQRQIDADQEAFEHQQTLSRLKLAGELRDLQAQWALAGAERELAVRKLADATQLAADVERRVQAGETARVDALQAQALVRQADGALVQADAARTRIHSQWRALTGLAGIPALADPPGTATDHPAVAAAQSHWLAARSRLARAEADQRDPMELGLSLTRERSSAGVPGETAFKVALRIPLNAESRNAPRLAAARAEVEAAQAEADALARQLDAEQTAAKAALDAAERNEVLATQRAALAAQIQALIVKAYQLGESDLPTRLRTDNERFEADLSLARTRIDVQRARAQLNQTFGLLP